MSADQELAVKLSVENANFAMMLRRMIWTARKEVGDTSMKALAGNAEQLLKQYGHEGAPMRTSMTNEQACELDLRDARAEIKHLRERLVESDRIADGYYRLMREASDKNERLRAYIESLDGKYICTSIDNGTSFIDDGIVVASDVLN